jgi:hypothetical protein
MTLKAYFDRKNLIRALRGFADLFVPLIIIGIMVSTAFIVGAVYYDVPIGVINPPPDKPSIPIPLTYPPFPGLKLQAAFLFSSMILKANSTIAEGVEIWATDGYAQQVSGNMSAIWTVSIGFQETFPWDFKSEIGKVGGILIGGLSGTTFAARQSGVLRLLSEDTFYFPVAGDYSPTMQIDFYNGTSVLQTYGDIKVHVLSASEIQQQKVNKTASALTWALVGFAYIEGVLVLKRFWDSRKHKQSVIHQSPNRNFYTPNDRNHRANYGEPEQIGKGNNV